MQDSAVVAAIVAGDADGVVAAYDQYATSLYGYCRRVLPGPEAAEAVLDTFLIATAKLDMLRDPDRLGPWLHAVARNECLRRLGPGGEIPAAADPGDEPLETPPADLRGRVPTVCADNTPAGRARRMSVAHRAGVFGPAGFPKTIGPNGPRWWRVLRQRVRRHPGVALAAAVVATLAATAGITVVMAAGGSHRPQASGLGLGGDVPASASSTPSGGTGRVPSPARTAPASALPTSPAALAGATSAGPPPGQGKPSPTASPSQTSPSPSASASSSPAQGYLLVTPARLVLTSKSGTPARGFIRLTALNGPVSHYTVRVAADPGRVKVAPAGGSLPVNGSVEVSVTVTSKVALTTHVVVGPGNITVTVVYKPQPAPTPSPSPKP
jgi:Sigma-70 region 2